VNCRPWKARRSLMHNRLPVSGPGSSDKVPITEDMIKAGREVLYRSGRLQYEALGADDLLIRSIYRAMIRVLVGRPQTPLGRRPVG
jgi:hypothetical protein